MKINITQANKVTVVAPNGDLDTAAAPTVRQTLWRLIDGGQAKLVVDLEGVAYMDSAGLGELVGAMKRAREAGGDLKLCGLREDVLRIFEMTRLNEGMAVYPTRQEVVKAWK